MRYEKQTILTSDRNPNGGNDYEAKFPFFVAEPVLEWDAEAYAGSNSHVLKPAYSADPEFSDDKGRCWLDSWRWNPDEGYIAEGYGSQLIPFEDGVKILVEHDVFSFPLPEEGG